MYYTLVSDKTLHIYNVRVGDIVCITGSLPKNTPPYDFYKQLTEQDMQPNDYHCTVLPLPTYLDEIILSVICPGILLYSSNVSVLSPYETYIHIDRVTENNYGPPHPKQFSAPVLCPEMLALKAKLEKLS